MAATVNVNGRVSDQEHAVISVFDHGFLYGEGVYETLRTYNGEPFLFDRHMRRLRNSARMLALDVPLTDDADRPAVSRDDARRRPRRQPRPRSLHPHPRDARHRRAHLRSRRLPDALVVVIVKPQRGAAARSLRARRQSGARRRRPQSSGLGQSADQVQQPAEQCARDAGGVQSRRIRGRDAELPRRTRRVHAVEPVHREERRGADAAASTRACCRASRANSFSRSASKRASRSASRCCATTISSAPTKRFSRAPRGRSCRSCKSTIA